MTQRSEVEPGWHQISGIAASTAIPEKFLEQILLTLKKAGYLKSRRGVDGGYALNQAPSQIRLDQIIGALEGRMLSGLDRPDDADEAVHVFREAVQAADDAAMAKLAEFSLEELTRQARERRQRRSGSMEFQI